MLHWPDLENIHAESRPSRNTTLNLLAYWFQPKAYKEDVPINLWQTEVINNGPAAAVSIYDAYMTNAVQAMPNGGELTLTMVLSSTRS